LIGRANQQEVVLILNHTQVAQFAVTLLLWTDYKQVENYKTRQALLIHQLVLVC
jgi:hypothetical protein